MMQINPRLWFFFLSSLISFTLQSNAYFIYCEKQKSSSNFSLLLFFFLATFALKWKKTTTTQHTNDTAMPVSPPSWWRKQVWGGRGGRSFYVCLHLCWCVCIAHAWTPPISSFVMTCICHACCIICSRLWNEKFPLILGS